MSLRLRPARREEAWALARIERDANLVALAHVFPPDRFPFPEDAVVARWALVLEDSGVTTLLAEEDSRLLAFVAYDDATVRHLAVLPEHWGRARGLYEHLGWRPTGVERDAEWPPHPTEVEYALPLQPSWPRMAPGP